MSKNSNILFLCTDNYCSKQTNIILVKTYEYYFCSDKGGELC